MFLYVLILTEASNLNTLISKLFLCEDPKSNFWAPCLKLFHYVFKLHRGSKLGSLQINWVNGVVDISEEGKGEKLSPTCGDQWKISLKTFGVEMFRHYVFTFRKECINLFKLPWQQPQFPHCLAKLLRGWNSFVSLKDRYTSLIMFYDNSFSTTRALPCGIQTCKLKSAV